MSIINITVFPEEVLCKNRDSLHRVNLTEDLGCKNHWDGGALSHIMISVKLLCSWLDKMTQKGFRKALASYPVIEQTEIKEDRHRSINAFEQRRMK